MLYIDRTAESSAELVVLRSAREGYVADSCAHVRSCTACACALCATNVPGCPSASSSAGWLASYYSKKPQLFVSRQSPLGLGSCLRTVQGLVRAMYIG